MIVSRAKLQGLEFVGGQACLPENAPEGADGYLPVVRNDDGAESSRSLLGKLDVTPPLTDLEEPCRFELALDLTVGQRSKRH